MEKVVKKLDHTSHLILHRTSQKEVRDGVTVIVKGEGVWVTDQDGKRYLDLDAGVTRPVHVGHGSKELAQVAYDQMATLGYCSGYTGSSNLAAIELAERLSSWTYPSINRFFFTSGGGESSD